MIENMKVEFGRTYKESDNPVCKAERGSTAIAKRKEEIVRGCGVLQR